MTINTTLYTRLKHRYIDTKNGAVSQWSGGTVPSLQESGKKSERQGAVLANKRQ